MKKYKGAFVSLLLVVLILLCACSQKINQDLTSTYPPNVSIDADDTEHIFLYKPYDYEIGIYDLELRQWERIDDGETPVQSFGWGNVYPRFVVGQYYVNSFYSGKISGNKLQFDFLLENKQEALAPFATNGEVFLYIIEQVTEDDFFKKIVTISDDGKLTLVANLDGMPVMGGVIVGDYLYFTCPIQDSDFYEVWSIDLTQSNQEQQPILVRDDYTSYKLYQYNGNLLFLADDGHSLYNNEFTIKLSQKADLITIDDEAGVLAEMYVNQENNLELAFTDISSGSILGKYQNAINFTRTDSIITIYGDGFIDQLTLPKGD